MPTATDHAVSRSIPPGCLPLDALGFLSPHYFRGNSYAKRTSAPKFAAPGAIFQQVHAKGQRVVSLVEFVICVETNIELTGAIG